jgi:hypothetical protein
MQKFNSLISTLIQVASTSKIIDKLAAVVIKGSKMLSRPVPNIDRYTCRGYVCGNMHAECNALLAYYGSSMTYSHRTTGAKWYLL